MDCSGLSRKAPTVCPGRLSGRSVYAFSAVFREKLAEKAGSFPSSPLQILDSTRIIDCKSKFPWAYYLPERSGIKFHVLYFPEQDVPADIRASKIGQGDTEPMTEYRTSFLPQQQSPQHSCFISYRPVTFVSLINRTGTFPMGYFCSSLPSCVF